MSCFRISKYLLLITSLFFICSCGATSGSTGTGIQTTPLSDTETLKYRTCNTDADCIVAENGCCDCANGGADISVNVDKLPEFRQNFSCKNVMCTEKAAVPACGSGTISCKANLCEYTSKG
ncbi:MAG: hypothetical protein WCQ47_06795 [bacterium]